MIYDIIQFINEYDWTIMAGLLASTVIVCWGLCIFLVYKTEKHSSEKKTLYDQINRKEFSRQLAIEELKKIRKQHQLEKEAYHWLLTHGMSLPEQEHHELECQALEGIR